MKLEEGISVVICCHNSVSRLEPTLKYLAEQRDAGRSVEVILVDNNSNDGTAAAARKIWDALGAPFALRIESESQPGLMHARRKGVEAARYSILVFCDDDNWLNPLYLQAASEYFAVHPDVGAIGGEGKVVSDVEIPDWFSYFSRQYACFPQVDSTLLYGAGLSVRTALMKHIFSMTQSFNLNGRIGGRLLGGDDHELVYMIHWTGYRTAYVPALTFHHYMPAQRLSLTYLEKLLKGAGYSAPFLWPYEGRNYGMGKVVYKLFRLFMGLPKIVLREFSNGRILNLRLRMHAVYAREVLSSFIENRRAVRQVAIRIKQVRPQYRMR